MICTRNHDDCNTSQCYQYVYFTTNIWSSSPMLRTLVFVFWSKLQLVQNNITPICKDRWKIELKYDYMRISGHIWTRTIKNTRHWMEYQKNCNTYLYLLIKCVLCYPKSGNVAQHYKRISRQISNDCLTLSVLGY